MYTTHFFLMSFLLSLTVLTLSSISSAKPVPDCPDDRPGIDEECEVGVDSCADGLVCDMISNARLETLFKQIELLPPGSELKRHVKEGPLWI